jgi:hypothetical protein
VRRGESWASGVSPVCPVGCPRVISGIPQGFAATCRLHALLTARGIRRGLSSLLSCDASTVAVVRRGHSCGLSRCARTVLCRPPRRPGASTAGALHAGGALSCGTAVVTELASRARMLRSWSRPSSRQSGPTPPHHAVRTRALLAPVAFWSSPRRRPRRMWRLQLWSQRMRLGPGCSRPGPVLHVGAWPDWARPRAAKPCLLRVVPCARGPCAARRNVLDSDLELSTLALS